MLCYHFIAYLMVACCHISPLGFFWLRLVSIGTFVLFSDIAINFFASRGHNKSQRSQTNFCRSLSAVHCMMQSKGFSLFIRGLSDHKIARDVFSWPASPLKDCPKPCIVYYVVLYYILSETRLDTFRLKVMTTREGVQPLIYL